ncbi:MAG: substrate-binding domain-containing protein [Ruminococcus sp.]
MKKTSTKLISVLAAGVIMASAFAGCGGSSSSTASNGESGNAGSSAASAAVSGAGSFDASKTLSVITREQGSGTRDAFVELTGVLVKDGDTKKDTTRTDAVTVNGTEAVITNVKGNEAAIGYISLGSLNDSVKALKIEDVDATAENVKSGEYKISRPFNIAYKGELSGLAKDFVDYILSSDGQAVVSKEGYVAVSENAAYAGTKPEGKITVAGSSSVSPVMEKLIEAYKQVNTKADIELQTSDSSAGMQSAIDGTCDIGMASRELKDTEKELTSTAIAKDGIAVIVNTGNTTENLTMDQVKAIYTGEAKVWSDITK